MDKEKLYKTKRKISVYSIIMNAFLMTIKFVGGLISHSSVLLADALHSFSDLAASFSVFIGIIISHRKSKNFPFGLYKVENLVALVSAFAIFMAGYEIAKDVLFKPSAKLTSLPVAIAVVIVTLLVTFFYSSYEKKMGKKLNSPSLIADAQHVFVDMIASLVVLLGIIAQYLNLLWLEKAAVVVVVLFVFHSGFEILKEAIKVLLDASVDHETLKQVEQILQNEPLVNKINSITGRNSGSFIFLELDLVLNTNSLEKAHKFSEEIEQKIKSQMPFVERVIVHFEQGHKLIKIAFLVHEDGRFCDHFGSCPYIAVFTKNPDGTFTKQIIENKYANAERRKGILLAEFLHELNIACLVVKHEPDSEAIKFALQSYFIDLILIDKESLDQIDINQIDCR